jgi:gluconokinase
MPQPPLVVVMGPSGSGKSTVGEALAARLGVPFVDADDLHPITNVDKMTAGQPLTDDDRWPWLKIVGRAVAEASATGVVVACSALRRAYREAILAEAPETVFVELHGTRELLTERMGRREGHFMPATLLDSQLATLEPLADDEPGVRVDIAPPVGEIVEAAAAQLTE